MDYYFSCPKCKKNKEFNFTSEQADNTGCLLFLLGHWFIALLLAGNRQNRVQCGSCGYIFRQPHFPTSAVSSLSNWIIIVILF